VLGAPHLDFEIWETTNSKKLFHPVRDLEYESQLHPHARLICFAMDVA
jgi:hypothetical protein